MQLLKLRVHNFRNYKQLSLSPHQGVTVFVGGNGAGKTNILEAVHLCCTAKSHRTNSDKDMINIGATSAAVHARVSRKHTQDEVGIRLFSNIKSKKIIYVNGKTVPKIGELIGHINCVMFSPEDLDIIKGGPQNRRKYIDILFSQCSPSYFFALQHYNNILKQRNAMLKLIAIKKEAQALDVWDEQLAGACKTIVDMRKKFMEKIKGYATQNYAYISDKETEFFQVELFGKLYEAADPSAHLLEMLHRTREEDIRKLSTSHGPHRDDLMLLLCGREMKGFASQGQIRTATLALKLSEIELLNEIHDEMPILLLDDVLNELDAIRRLRLLSRIKDAQTLITSTDLNDISESMLDCVLSVKDGELSVL